MCQPQINQLEMFEKVQTLKNVDIKCSCFRVRQINNDREGGDCSDYICVALSLQGGRQHVCQGLELLLLSCGRHPAPVHQPPPHQGYDPCNESLAVTAPDNAAWLSIVNAMTTL